MPKPPSIEADCSPGIARLPVAQPSGAHPSVTSLRIHKKQTCLGASCWVLTTFEELFEMIFLSLLVYALLVHIVARHGGFALFLTKSYDK